MIVDLPSSSVSDVNKALVRLRLEGGVQALGRVLTLVIVTDDGSAIEAQPHEGLVDVGNAAGRQVNDHGRRHVLPVRAIMALADSGPHEPAG